MIPFVSVISNPHHLHISCCRDGQRCTLPLHSRCHYWVNWPRRASCHQSPRSLGVWCPRTVWHNQLCTGQSWELCHTCCSKRNRKTHVYPNSEQITKESNSFCTRLQQDIKCDPKNAGLLQHFFTHQLPLSAASFSLLPAQRRMLGWCCRRRTCVVTSASTLERKSSFTGYMLQANIMSSQIRMPNSSAICKWWRQIYTSLSYVWNSLWSIFFFTTAYFEKMSLSINSAYISKGDM